jgi:hypothetical protein
VVSSYSYKQPSKTFFYGSTTRVLFTDEQASFVENKGPPSSVCPKNLQKAHCDPYTLQ